MRHSAYNGVKLFSCNANHELARSIGDELKSISNSESLESGKFDYGGLGVSQVDMFNDGEISIKIGESVRGADVFIVQPTCGSKNSSVNDNLMELLIMIDAVMRASAGRITAVIPYFGYARQDRKARARDPISAKLIADIITAAGADRVLSMDLHCDQLQGFFNIPVDHLRGMPLFYKYYSNKFDDMQNVMVVSPDLGSVARARRLAEKLDVPLAIVDKRRSRPGESEVVNLIGDVRGKTVIILDDLIDTAGSLTNAAEALVKHGAKDVYACATHALFSGKALSRIENSEIKELVVLDTIPVFPEKQIPKIKVISVASIFALAIYSIHSCLPVSKLFD